MAEWTEAERYLLEHIRSGDQAAWAQLVERYQGRLLAFARRRAPRHADPEDLVQDTFLQFLRGLASFRGQASVETFLFLILRRRIIEMLRGKKLTACNLPDSSGDDSSALELPAPDASASWYVGRDEQRDAAKIALADALKPLVHSLQAELNFRDLQILEMLFYAQRPNREIAGTLGVGAEHVAMVKHRWLKAVRARVESMDQSWSSLDPAALDSLLSEVWEDQRPSCPKRSTVGGYLLKTLDEPWQNYVAFHVESLGCAYCRASLDDLDKQTRVEPAKLRDRIMQSTIGFFRHTTR
jgi:RNA polymerase sigma factor (sigma-70 family)